MVQGRGFFNYPVICNQTAVPRVIRGAWLVVVGGDVQVSFIKVFFFQHRFHFVNGHDAVEPELHTSCEFGLLR